MSTFDVVLFDIGGVLLVNGWGHQQRRAVLEHFGIDREAFERLHLAANDAWERDELDWQGYLTETVFYDPRPFTPEAMLAYMQQQSRVLEDSAVDILREIAQVGKHLVGALNNESRAIHEYRVNTFGLVDLFQFQFCSCYLAMRKPEVEIYKRALDLLGRPAERVLFIDDREENVAGARAAGIVALQYKGSAGLRAELLELGVL